MGAHNREIEIKLLVEGIRTLPPVVAKIQSLWETMSDEGRVLVGNASDYYWNTPKSSNADFARLRKRSKDSSGGQLTIKSTDKKDNVDRIEIDLDVDDHAQALAYMKGLMGEPVARVTKKYHVFFLEDEHTNISVYQIRNDDRVFVEIEAKTLKKVIQILNKVIESTGYDYLWVKSSIYQMFVQQRAMVTRPIEEFLKND
jgi:adenylate cyclase class IV